MEEASCISRGKISPLSDAKAENFDAVIIPEVLVQQRTYVISRHERCSV